MGWLARMMFVAGGLFMILLASTQLKAGNAVFPNASYHQTTFAASGFGVGLVLLLLAFLPSNDWVSRHITTKKPQPKFLRKRQRGK